MCQGPAFCAFLAFLARFGINNLRVFKGARSTSPPLRTIIIKQLARLAELGQPFILGGRSGFVAVRIKSDRFTHTTTFSA